jgi:demethylmenaquinone methyltransferase / 2-methoxy-6-polyprenyl-1,4-benzoquinol methylase
MQENSPSPDSSAAPPGPPRQNVWSMFDRIAPRYDLLNRVLSLRQDVRWRKRLVRHLPPGKSLDVLDIATGTADVLLTLHDAGRLRRGVGIDMAKAMLELGRAKLVRRGLTNVISLKEGDATRLDEQADSYDCTTISFGIRNVVDTGKALSEMYRVIRPGGRSLILECSMPANACFRAFYLFYFRHVLPRLGALVSGDGYAYRYLNETVETFPHGEAFLELMRQAHFVNVQRDSLTFGIATIYSGEKPAGGG